MKGFGTGLTPCVDSCSSVETDAAITRFASLSNILADNNNNSCYAAHLWAHRLLFASLGVGVHL